MWAKQELEVGIPPHWQPLYAHAMSSSPRVHVSRGRRAHLGSLKWPSPVRTVHWQAPAQRKSTPAAEAITRVGL
jgi:hypothetical protein